MNTCMCQSVEHSITCLNQKQRAVKFYKNDTSFIKQHSNKPTSNNEPSIPAYHIAINFFKIYRGSYISAHVLLNLLNKLGDEINARLAEHFIAFS